jgi:hypothetical protein
MPPRSLFPFASRSRDLRARTCRGSHSQRTTMGDVPSARWRDRNGLGAGWTTTSRLTRAKSLEAQGMTCAPRTHITLDPHLEEVMNTKCALGWFALGALVLSACGSANDSDVNASDQHLTGQPAAASTPAASTGGNSSKDDDPANPINAQRFAMLEKMLPKLATEAANDFTRAAGIPSLGKFVSSTCKGPKSAEAQFPGVTLGDCAFTFESAKGTTVFTGFTNASITVPGMPDDEQPNDPKTHEPPPATTTRVDSADVTDGFISDGFVPPLPKPFSFSDEKALGQFAHDIAARHETDTVEDEDVDMKCEGLDLTAAKKKFAGASDVKFACFNYLADLFNGQILMALQVKGDSVVGVRYLEFGGNF